MLSNKLNKHKNISNSKRYKNLSIKFYNNMKNNRIEKKYNKKVVYLYPSSYAKDIRYFKFQKGRFSFRRFFNERKFNPAYIVKPKFLKRSRKYYHLISRKRDARIAKLLKIKLIYKNKKLGINNKLIINKRKSRRPVLSKTYRRNLLKKIDLTSNAYKIKRLIKKCSLEYKQNLSNFSFKHRVARMCLGHLIRKGQKAWAEKTLSEAFFLIKKKYFSNPSIILLKAIQNLKPTLGLRPKKKGGVIYRVPFLLKDTKQWSLAMLWLVNAVRQKTGASSNFSNKLYLEITDIIENKAHSALKKKEEIHKLALTNRPFLK
jgi:small subunit ribosomal protein S7